MTGWLEAFAAHPKIGDLEGLRKKFGGFAELSKGEQAAAAGATEGVLQVGRWGMRCWGGVARATTAHAAQALLSSQHLARACQP